MKQLVSKSLVLFLAVAILAPLAPLGIAQKSSITQVSTNPAGLSFSIDGQFFTQTTGALWPAGSKHLLYALPMQGSLMGDIQYTFSGWQWAGGTLLGGTQVTVTADPSISSYQAMYTTAYAVNVNFFSCPSGNCASPGTVFMNGSPFTQNGGIYVAAGTQVILQAFPNSGYVFAGWGSTNSGTVILGFQQTITATQPMTFYPLFQMARTINLASVPSTLQVLQDRTPITTPASVQWGVGSTHTLGVISPQVDLQGQWWAFSSWSDGGTSTHAYTVAAVVNPDTLTATFVPAALSGFFTDPPGLSLSIDGRTNWPTYDFTWGVGEIHTVSAPAQQTDAQGRIWNFSKWSNGGPATQTVTVTSAMAANGLRLTASYTQVAQLTVTATVSGLAVTVNGSSCALPCNVYQSVGAQVDLGAPASMPVSPGSRQDFLSWSVNGATATGTAANGDLLVTLGTAPVTAAPAYHLMNSLTASANPSAGANFTLQPSSLDGFYDSQTTVNVSASVLPGFKFGSWNGDLTGPTAAGSITMSAPRTITAMLVPVPYILPSGIVNGAGVTPQAVLAPGSVASVFGVNLASATAVGNSSPMAQTLGGVTARIGAQMLPLFFVSPAQINFQLPPGLPPGAQTLTVSAPGQPDVEQVFQVAADAPGIFLSSVADGVTFGLVTHPDGSLVTSAAPAQAGETLTLFGTGFGQTVPARPEGFAVPALPVYFLTDPATVQVGGVSSALSSAYAWPGAVGVDVLQFVVPAGLPSATNAPLTVTINGAVSNAVQLPIQ